MVVGQFDSFIKKGLSNELKYYIRSRENRKKHMIVLSELSDFEMNQLCHKDIYYFDEFEDTIKTSIFDVVIHDELLYNALQLLNSLNREIIVLKYWEEMTDREIGHILNMSQQTVNYKKNKAIKLLKKIIEEMKNNDSGTDI